MPLVNPLHPLKSAGPLLRHSQMLLSHSDTKSTKPTFAVSGLRRKLAFWRCLPCPCDIVSGDGGKQPSSRQPKQCPEDSIRTHCAGSRSNSADSCVSDLNTIQEKYERSSGLHVAHTGEQSSDNLAHHDISLVSGLSWILFFAWLQSH